MTVTRKCGGESPIEVDKRREPLYCGPPQDTYKIIPGAGRVTVVVYKTSTECHVYSTTVDPNKRARSDLSHYTPGKLHNDLGGVVPPETHRSHI